MNKARFEAFSDAVFAFAITLLALGFVLPNLHEPSNRQLAGAILRLWPNLIAYVLSFSVIRCVCLRRIILIAATGLLGRI